ncbi:unnamed protein product [Pieris brassicae]|uniref:DUF1308 domain-containing protein n=1 Tax=Pieris brassicae TaxID=7116 RepID=A0A9P0TUW6_PIEBR|nr:unnamed protein product [Pieris brassicae]
MAASGGLECKMSLTAKELICMLEEKIQYARDLIERLQIIKIVEGVLKLQRKIQQEMDFLMRLKKSKKFKVEQLSCSNLRHLGAMVNCALRPGVVSVCKIFHINADSKLVIDIISDNGKIWTKVIARNPKSLSALSEGNASYGARSILDQAGDYVECAQLYPCMFKPPKVIFEFVSGIEKNLAHRLKSHGIVVSGEILPNSTNYFDECSDSSSAEDTGGTSTNENAGIFSNDIDIGINTLNLDVTAMMAYVSNMTNGYCKYLFKQDVLTQQAAWDDERPVKPILDKLFEGKRLVCCRTAWDNFEKIVQTLGGPMEKKRSMDLKELLTIYNDDYGGPDDYPRQNLKVRGNVRLRSKTVFNFGHRIKALTVSANVGFIRAATQQGVNYAAFIHESRALTEGKEGSATKIL